MLNLNLPADQLRTMNDPEPEACILEGTEHDFRPNTYVSYGVPHTSFVCVWCHGVACGNYGEHDPCMEIYHHTTPHKARSGASWPVGSYRARILEDGVPS